jgi:hypothetical protein
MILFAVLLFHLLAIYTAAQEIHVSQPTMAHTPFNISDIDGIIHPTPTGFNVSGVPSNSTITILLNNSAPYYSPSPTSFIFTHYPTHTSVLNASSSARPSQSAPLPDDTIGKYGRLHISSARCLTSDYLLSLILIVLITFLS